MIFKSLAFHISTRYGEEPVTLLRPFRRRINYLLDSFSLRIPKQTRTELLRKLNVRVRYERSQRVPFYALEGIGCVEFVDPGIVSIYTATQSEAVELIKGFLRRGFQVAAKSDPLFASHLELWEELLSTAEEEFDFDCRVSRSHPSRRWRCEAVLRISPAAYHYDVLIKDSKSEQTIHRHRIRSTECVLPLFTGIGFSKLRWEKEEVVGLTSKDAEVFRFTAFPPSFPC